MSTGCREVILKGIDEAIDRMLEWDRQMSSDLDVGGERWKQAHAYREYYRECIIGVVTILLHGDI